MVFVSKIPVVLVIAGAAVVLGQMTITSEDSRNTFCVNEDGGGDTMTYTCIGEGSTLFVSAPSYINEIFVSTDPVPSARISPNAVLTLITGAPNYSVRLQLLNVTEAVNVTCRTNLAGSEATMPLALSNASPVPPPRVEITGRTGDTTTRAVDVAWNLPNDTSFTVQEFILTIMLDGTPMMSSRVVGISCVVNVPFSVRGEITAMVATVSTCNDVGDPMPSTGSLQATYDDFYAAFLVPLLIIFILIIIIVVLVILLLRREKSLKSKQVQDTEQFTVKETSA